jgi:hypothetical protein
MRKLLLLFGLCVFGLHIQAQDYDDVAPFVEKAKGILAFDKIETTTLASNKFSFIFRDMEYIMSFQFYRDKVIYMRIVHLPGIEVNPETEALRYMTHNYAATRVNANRYAVRGSFDVFEEGVIMATSRHITDEPVPFVVSMDVMVTHPSSLNDWLFLDCFEEFQYYMDEFNEELAD